MSKLGKKIFIIFLLLIILSLFLVGLFINFSIGEKFDDFINLQREKSIQELAELITEAAAKNDFKEVRSLVKNFSRTNKIPIWLQDEKGNFIYFSNQSRHMSNMMGNMGMNSSHLRMMNQLPDDFPGRNKKELIYSDGRKIFTLYWKELAAKNQLDSEIYNYFKKNIYQAIIFSAAIVIFLIIILSFIISKKITTPLIKLKNAALAVAQGDYKEKIEAKGQDELTELIEAFNLMTKKLKKLDKIRKESTSDLAHELRTPLTTLSGYLEAIEDGKLKADLATIKEMQEETKRITKLVENLNDFANAQNKVFNLKKEKIDLKPIIKKVLKHFTKSIKDKNIELKLNLDSELYLNGDQDSLFQIVDNIIENAIKYNKQNGKIIIEAKKEKDYLIINFKDTGLGIKAKDLPYIFERFYRTDQSRNSKNQGSGIGLAVVKELVEAHNGKIKAQSNEQQGTIFKLKLPALKT